MAIDSIPIFHIVYDVSKNCKKAGCSISGEQHGPRNVVEAAAQIISSGEVSLPSSSLE